MHALAYRERRRFTRKKCALEVGLDDYEKICSGHVYNLSRGGAFIKTVDDEAPQVGKELILTILNRRKADFLILKGTVAWRSRNGVGVQFVT